MSVTNLIDNKLPSRLVWTIIVSYAFTLEKSSAILTMLSHNMRKLAQTGHLAQYCVSRSKFGHLFEHKSFAKEA